MGQTHLVGIGSDSKIFDRLKIIADEFLFKTEFFSTCEALSEKFEANTSVRVAVLLVTDITYSSEVAGKLQALKYACQTCYTILIVDKKLPPDCVGFIKKSGADLIIDEADAYETSFLEFILSQRIRGFMIPIKPQDIKIDTTVPFKILTILPLNEKYLPLVLANEKIKPGKAEKLNSTRELYVSREDLDQLQEYINKNCDRSAEGIASRCRINYMSLCKAHTDFMVSLFDKADRATFSAGKSLLEKCSAIASEMLMNLSTLTDPWSIINNGTVGETGSVERSPAIAAMAGLTTMNLTNVNTEDTVLAGFLADVGCLTLPPELLKKIRTGKTEDLSKDELNKYHQHPIFSVNKCLDKRLPLNDTIKNIILTTHEKLDRSGFPRRVDPKSIAKESQLLQFCEMIDQRLTIKMGSKSEDARDIQIKIVKEEIAKKSVLDINLSTELQKVLNTSQGTGKAA